MDSRDIAYLLATALQKKLSKGHVGVRIEALPSGRLIIEYVYRVDRFIAQTAYTEGFFDVQTKEHLSWLGTTIRTQLEQRLLWKQPKVYDNGIHDPSTPTHASSSHASSPDKTRRPRAAKVSLESIP